MCATSTAVAVILKKVESKLLTEEAKHVAGGHIVTQAVWGKGKPRWHMSTLARTVCGYVRHASTRSTLEREHVKHVGTWARMHAR